MSDEEEEFPPKHTLLKNHSHPYLDTPTPSSLLFPRECPNAYPSLLRNLSPSTLLAQLKVSLNSARLRLKNEKRPTKSKSKENLDLRRREARQEEFVRYLEGVRGRLEGRQRGLYDSALRKAYGPNYAGGGVALAAPPAAPPAVPQQFEIDFSKPQLCYAVGDFETVDEVRAALVASRRANRLAAKMRKKQAKEEKGEKEEKRKQKVLAAEAEAQAEAQAQAAAIKKAKPSPPPSSNSNSSPPPPQQWPTIISR